MRVAVVRLDALGDTLLSTPALAALQAARPEVELRLFASAVGAPILESLGEVVVVPADWSAGRLAAAIREGQPQAVAVLTEKRRGLAAAYRSKAPMRLGFDPGRSQPLKAVWLRLALTHRCAYPNNLELDPGLHEVERYHRLLAPLGPLPEPGPLRLGRSFPRPPAGPIGLQLTPKWCLDDWSPQLVLTLLDRLPDPALVLYGPGEREWAEKLLGEHPVERAFHPDLMDYAAAVAGCSLLLTPDTGAAHVAAAVGTPVVDVFREAHHQHCVRRWRPWQVDHRVVLKPAFSPQALVKLVDEVSTALAELSAECR